LPTSEAEVQILSDVEESIKKKRKKKRECIEEGSSSTDETSVTKNTNRQKGT
jgi:hypothetical protein